VATSTPPERGRGSKLSTPFRETTLRYFATEAINALATVGGVAAFTRLVPPPVYGEYAVILAACGVAMAVAGEWLQATALRFAGPRPTRPDAVRALLDLLLISLAMLAMVGVLALAFLPMPPGASAILVGMLYASLSLTFLTLTAVFQANLESGRFAAYRSGFGVLRILLAIALALLWRRSAIALVGGQAIALAILLPFVLSHLLRGLGRSQPEARRRQRSAMFAFGGPLIGWYAASQLLNLSDRFFLQAWRGSTEVGLYAVSYALVMGAIATTLQPILSAVYPLMVRSWHQGGTAAAQWQFDMVIRLFLVLAPGLWGFLWFFGNDFLSILAPSAYQTPRVLLGCLAAGILCWYGGLYVQKALELELRSRSLLRILWIAASVNLAANLVLIPRWGLLGAGAATLLGYGSYLSLTLLAIQETIHVAPPPRLAVSIGLAFVALVGVGVLLGAVLGDSSHGIRLFLGAPIAAGAYAAVIVGRGEHRVDYPA
jgi:O-antigen/teichoic acid export membrane protein